MSRVIGQCNSRRKSTLKHGRRFKTLTLAASAGLLLIGAYFQAFPVVAQQDPPRAKAQVAYIPGATAPSAAADDATLPDLSSLDVSLLIRESDRLGTAMHLQLPEYTYLQKRLSRELDQRGKMVEHAVVYEAYPITVQGRHRHIISMISEDGSPVSPKRLKQERLQAAKEIEKAEREGAGGAPADGAGRYVTAGIGVNQMGDGVWIGVSQFLRQCRFGAPRYGRLADRYMIALDIRSCSGDVSDPRERYLAGMTGVVWIDTADKVVARLQAWPRRATPEQTTLAPMDSETIVYEQMRLPNGLWVPKRIQLNAIGKAAMFNGTDKDMIFEFSHYQRFATEVKDIQQMTLKPKQ
jgi:hypothetical protein